MEAGYEKFEPKKVYAPGQKIYFIQEHKAVVAATIGQKPFEEGFRLVIAHIDSPRLDLRPNPLYESNHFSYFKTHYYGGIRKYQWGTIPLAIHGVFTDLLPHLGAEQNDRKLSEGIKAEELNVLIGSDAVEDADIKEAVKLNTLMLLHEKYGVTERDFTRAEIEVVPAHKARDIGFDRSMVGGYGHDDRVDAYPALMAEIETKDPLHTTVCVLTDKEEIGSYGNTGMESSYFVKFVMKLLALQGKDTILDFYETMENSEMLSADVNSCMDPMFAEVSEKDNASFLGYGINLTKYGGARGKSGSNDAEFLQKIRTIFNEAGVCWQIGELGKVDQGGGGTIAFMMADWGAEVVDCGTAMLSMHAPYDLLSKADAYETYLAYKAFFESK